ncbi:MAG: hypothetical protein JNL93_01880 [Pelomonas sp.]|nr:hypothetical protein [Roseateles sp.]
MDRLTSYKPTFYAGGACVGIAEPGMMILYNSGYLNIDEAFQVGAGFFMAGSLGLSFGVQKFLKALRLQQEQERKDGQLTPIGLVVSPAHSHPTLGTCPNCSAELPIASPSCTKCGALFGQGSGWKVQPMWAPPAERATPGAKAGGR